jgi:hypothetical protein
MLVIFGAATVVARSLSPSASSRCSWWPPCARRQGGKSWPPNWPPKLSRLPAGGLAKRKIKHYRRSIITRNHCKDDCSHFSRPVPSTTRSSYLERVNPCLPPVCRAPTLSAQRMTRYPHAIEMCGRALGRLLAIRGHAARGTGGTMAHELLSVWRRPKRSSALLLIDSPWTMALASPSALARAIATTV